MENSKCYSVSKEVSNKLPYIVAVDFDGTIVEDKFPAIGEVRKDIIDLIKIAQQKGSKVILWTCRDGLNLREAVSFCNDLGIHFDAVNKNIEEVISLYNNDTRKIFANEYWDDKGVSLFCNISTPNQT